MKRQGRYYEWELLQHLHKYAPRGGLYLDVGANIGSHSIFFARFMAEQVLAVEPNKFLHATLLENLKTNVPDNCDTVGLAIGDEPGYGRIKNSELYPDNVAACQVESCGEEDRDAFEITTIDILINSYFSLKQNTLEVSLIKLDIEGMESRALSGAVNTISQFLPDIVVEAKTSPEWAAVNNALSPYGYRQFAVFGPSNTYHYTCRS